MGATIPDTSPRTPPPNEADDRPDLQAGEAGSPSSAVHTANRRLMKSDNTHRQGREAPGAQESRGQDGQPASLIRHASSNTSCRRTEATAAAPRATAERPRNATNPPCPQKESGSWS